MLEYDVPPLRGRKVLAREVFATGEATNDRSDLWWGGATQDGWGITIHQQGSTLMSVWYTYNAFGLPTWYVMPGGTWTAADTYEGRLFRTKGSPWLGAPYDAAKLSVTDAGTYRLQFSGPGAIFTYEADGHSGSIPLVRQPF